MKSFTGNFSSVRGWAPLLALLFGAGMMISACGDEEVPAPTTPAPPPPAPPPDPEPEPEGPAMPENLRVTAMTSTSITWTWDAVEGVLGYQGQFSPDATFTDTDATFIIAAPLTSHTVSNLSGNMTGHFRVRSGVGTAITELTFSEWTESVSGSTTAPPPATAFDAPGGFSAGNATDDSIALSWDEVDGAEEYEVEQRLAGAGGNWGDADCGGSGSNVVDGTSCVASDLDEGTGYEFRVRALPAADDTVNAIGAWAETDGSTTGRQETTVSGGMGDLNVTWESDAETITFSWEPMAGTTYEWKEIGTDDATRLAAVDAANPCSGATFFDAPTGMGANFSHTFTSVAAGDIRGLCVRIDDDDLDDDEKATSFAWGATTPVAPTAAAAATIDVMDEKQVATALDWTAVMLKKGFEWELRLVADSGRGDGDLDGSATAKPVQNACGKPAPSWTRGRGSQSEHQLHLGRRDQPICRLPAVPEVREHRGFDGVGGAGHRRQHQRDLHASGEAARTALPGVPVHHGGRREHANPRVDGPEPEFRQRAARVRRLRGEVHHLPRALRPRHGQREQSRFHAGADLLRGRRHHGRPVEPRWREQSLDAGGRDRGE